MSVCWFSVARVCLHWYSSVCTGYGFPQYRYASQYWLWSPTVHVCAGSFHSTCVNWSWSPTARACVGSFRVRVCTGHGLPARVCAGGFHSTCVYWICLPTARVCASSSAVHGCTGYGFLWTCADMAYCSMTVQLAMIPAFPRLPSVTQNMFVMRHTVT